MIFSSFWTFFRRPLLISTGKTLLKIVVRAVRSLSLSMFVIGQGATFSYDSRCCHFFTTVELSGHSRSNWDIGLCLYIEGLEPAIGNWHAKTASTFVIDLFSYLHSWSSELTNKKSPYLHFFIFNKFVFGSGSEITILKACSTSAGGKCFYLYWGYRWFQHYTNITIKITVIDLSVIWKLVYR